MNPVAEARSQLLDGLRSPESAMGSERNSLWDRRGEWALNQGSVTGLNPGGLGRGKLR